MESMGATGLDDLTTLPSVVIKLKSSSQKGGKEGYEISVTDQCTDAKRKIAIKQALAARTELLEAGIGDDD